jgi:hypothetical protein
VRLSFVLVAENHPVSVVLCLRSSTPLPWVPLNQTAGLCIVLL